MYHTTPPQNRTKQVHAAPYQLFRMYLTYGMYGMYVPYPSSCVSQRNQAYACIMYIVHTDQQGMTLPQR